MTSIGDGADPARSLTALVARTDSVGLIEHARSTVPAPEFGHCTDDAGRALGLMAQMSAHPAATVVARACLRQLETSLRSDGRFTLRLDEDGEPTQDQPSDDADARAVWGLALASISDLDGELRQRALDLLGEVAGFASGHPRAAAHAVKAGAALVRANAHSPLGRRLLDANGVHVPRPTSSTGWRWPESRMTYGNGLIVEALLDLAEVDRDDALLADSVALLEWLVDLERSADGHFRFTPVAGRGPGDRGGFDQQPIEAWTLADACARAHAISGEPKWVSVCRQLVAWFDGDNDLHVRMWDAATGAAYDGLTGTGVNLNEGTESTLALIGTALALERCIRT